MSRKIIPMEYKYALVLAYGQRCAACSEFKEDAWKDRNLVIDHILPIKYDQKKYKKEKEEAFEKFGLPDSFDLNSILNLRPVCAGCNNTKSDAVFSEITQLALEKASRKKREVEKYIKKFHTTPEVLKIMASLEKLQNSGSKIEDILDEVTGMSYRFSYKKKKEIVEGFDCKALYLENSSGSINAFLPSEKDIKGSCLFTINSHYVREAMITLESFTILNKYYGGSQTPLDLGMRKYILKDFKDEGYYLDLGNTRVFLTEDQTEGFVDLLDDFIDEYVKELLAVYEKKELSNFFPRDNQFEEYQIATSTIGVWNLIDRFIKGHDYQRNDKESWNIFDAMCTNMIKVIDPETSEFKAFIKVKKTVDHFGNEEMQYYWWDFDNSYEKNLWTIVESQEWLLKQLLPKVIDEYLEGENSERNRFTFFKKQKDLPKAEVVYSNYMLKSSNVIVQTEDLECVSDASNVLTKLEDLYMRRIEYTRVGIEPLMKIFLEIEKEFKEMDLEKIKDPNHRYYFSQKFPIKIDEAKKQLEQNIENTWIEGYVLGNAFGVLDEMITSMEKNRNMKMKLIRMMKNGLNEYIQELNERNIIQGILNVYK